MKTALFGATGGTGRAILAEAGRRGHSARLLVRPESAIPAEAGEVVRGALTDPKAVREVIGGADWVVCVFGPRAPFHDVFCAEATRIVVETMSAAGVSRLVCQTGAMIGPPTANVSGPMRWMARRFRASRPEVASDRTRQEDVVRESSLDWTIVKPPRLTDGSADEAVKMGCDVRVGLMSSVSRNALARAILDILEQGTHLHRAVYVRKA